MRCPKCGFDDSKVLDSRPVDENNSIRRRRECLSCHNRFTTYEIIDVLNPIVIKKNGSRELFDKNKLLSGIIKACEKRPVDATVLCAEIEQAVLGSMKAEITTQKIGDMVMDRLKALDPVAYVRFASVHREFKDIDSFAKEISELRSEEDKKED